MRKISRANLIDLSKRQSRRLRMASNTARSLPSFSFHFIKDGVLPAGPRALKILASEGTQDWHWKLAGDSTAKFFQKCGPLLTKMGQILANRNDLLPESFCSRLQVLYDSQPPMPFWQVKRVLRKKFGSELPFYDFEEEPLGVGSIGQVHRARLQNGDRVIVKILRPRIAKLIERDLDTATLVLTAYTKTLPKKHAGLRSLILRSLEDLAISITKEANLELEAKSLQNFGTRFKRHKHIYIPRLYSDLSDRNVLIMEELIGKSLSELQRSGAPLDDETRAIGDMAIREIVRQVFEDGQFHADPHAGNLFLMEDGRLGFIDFGLTGEFTKRDRKNIARAVKAFLGKDPAGVVNSLLEFGETPPGFDLNLFKADIARVFQKHSSRIKAYLSGAEKDPNTLQTFVSDLFQTASDHHVFVPSSSMLLIKTLVTVEGVARSLNPDLDLKKTAFPVVIQSLFPKWLFPKFWRGS